MSEQAPIETVLAAMKVAWESGCPVARPDRNVAAKVVRRWFSSSLRGVRQDDPDARVKDLVVGMIATCEDNPAIVGPLKVDYRYLAEVVAAHFGMR